MGRFLSSVAGREVVAANASVDWARRRARKSGSGGGASVSVAARRAAICASSRVSSWGFMLGLSRAVRCVVHVLAERLPEGVPGPREAGADGGLAGLFARGDPL